MGGRAAELVVFGRSEVTQGAAGDLQTVTRLCREMVTRYGFSSLGPVALESDGPEVFLGRDWMRTDPHYSGQTGQRIDQQVRSLASTAQERALSLLGPRRQLMDLLVERLIAEETINGDSFRETVERWEAENRELTTRAYPLDSILAGEASGEADVQAAKVGV
jgi:cell division protease FtsH